jgi:hypothetical protein
MPVNFEHHEKHRAQSLSSKSSDATHRAELELKAATARAGRAKAGPGRRKPESRPPASSPSEPRRRQRRPGCSCRSPETLEQAREKSRQRRCDTPGRENPSAQAALRQRRQTITRLEEGKNQVGFPADGFCGNTGSPEGGCALKAQDSSSRNAKESPAGAVPHPTNRPITQKIAVGAAPTTA